jgi:hypothetical protein
MNFVTASQKAIQESEQLEQERQQREATLKRENLDRDRQSRKAVKLRNVVIVGSSGVMMIVGIITWWQLQNIEIWNMLFSSDPVTNLKLISKLPQLLGEAKQLSQEGANESDKAIDYYNHILNQAKKLQKDSRSSPQEQKIISVVLNESEIDLIALIKKTRITGLLQKQLKDNMFGERRGKIGERDTNYEDLDKQFTDALQTTYKILMIDTGADINRNGILDNTDEVSSIPCDILREVEIAWRQSTYGHCGFTGKNGISSSCKNELKGQNLTTTLFFSGSRSLFREHLLICKI